MTSYEETRIHTAPPPPLPPPLAPGQYVFMDMTSYEETRIPRDEDWAKYLKEGMDVSVLLWNGKVCARARVCPCVCRGAWRQQPTRTPVNPSHTHIPAHTHTPQVISVDLPNTVDLEVVETDPGVRGNTASGGSKPATLETGAVIQVGGGGGRGDRAGRVFARGGHVREP